MKKIAFIILVLSLITGCEPLSIKEEKNDKVELTIEEIVEQKLDEMTLEEKIAQMLILYYYSDTVTDNLKNTITNVKPGGFILFNENITTYEKTLKFVKDLQEKSEIPLFISVDQEGGRVQRLQNLQDPKATFIPAMYDLGLTNDEALAYDVGRVMAQEMRTIGINMVFAPVVDIYSNKDNKVIGTRSFGSDKETVSKMAISLAKGLEDNQVIAVYKHFPGHGDTSTDSHYDLPIITKTLDELQKEELVPFANAIKNNAQVIMIGHLAVPSITKDNTPASLSKEIITDLLRKEMGFEGLVVTDGLNMGAVTNNYTNKEIYEKAINAGVDLLLMPGNSKETINYIITSIKEGKIKEEQIDTSVKRILTLKYSKLTDYKYLDKSYLNSESNQKIISQIK